MTGLRFSGWLVLHQAGNTVNGKALWLCKCDCGTERLVVGADLRQEKSKNCGCENNKRIGNVRRIHGKTGTRLHVIWKNMRSRCNNPAHPGFATWGGRGVRICEAWDDFTAFEAWAVANGYRDDLSIERLNVDGNYEPGNCAWATPLEQSVNRRFVLRNADGVAWSQIAKANGIPVQLMHGRIHEGWPIEKAATLPKGARLATPTPSS